MSPDPARAERVIAADRSASDAILEALVVPVQKAEERLENIAAEWERNARVWVDQAHREDDEDTAARLFAAALDSRDGSGATWAWMTPMQVAAELTEWYLAREAA